MIWIPLAILVAALMEPWSRLVHGKVWHGVLWRIHRSHHRPGRGLEANDVFAVLHAPPAAALIIAGIETSGVFGELMLGVGAGMTAFGGAYFVVHDGFIHGRLPVRFLGRIPVIRRIQSAHEEHHERNAAPYGLFLGPQELASADSKRPEE